MSKCHLVLIKLPRQRRKQISLAAARLDAASCFLLLLRLLPGAFKDSRQQLLCAFVTTARKLRLTENDSDRSFSRLTSEISELKRSDLAAVRR